MDRSKPRKIGEGESFSKNVIKGFSIPVNPWNKIPRRATKFILSGWIFASNHFSREKEGRRGAAYVNPVRRCTDGQTKATPSAVWKKFHYSLIPLPPSYRCSFHPLPPDTLHRTCTSPHLGRQIRQEESQNLISRDAPSPKAFSSYSPPSSTAEFPSISHHRRIKTAGRRRRGRGRVSLTAFAAVGSRVARMADVS